MGWAAAAGALLGGASSALSGFLQYQTAKKLMKKQYEYNTKALRTYYTNNRYSLENAGYNPLLGIPGSSAQGFTPSSTGIGVDLAGGIQAGAEAVNSAKKVTNETKATNSQVEVNSAETALKEEQTKTEQAKREQMAIDNLKTKAETTLKDKEASWYDKRQAKEIDKMISEAEYNRGMLEVNKYNSQTERINAFTNKQNSYWNGMNARTNAKNMQINSAVGASQEWRNYNEPLGYNRSFGAYGVSGSSNWGTPEYVQGRPKPQLYDRKYNKYYY